MVTAACDANTAAAVQAQVAAVKPHIASARTFRNTPESTGRSLCSTVTPHCSLCSGLSRVSVSRGAPPWYFSPAGGRRADECTHVKYPRPCLPLREEVQAIGNYGNAKKTRVEMRTARALQRKRNPIPTMIPTSTTHQLAAAWPPAPRQRHTLVTAHTNSQKVA